METAATKYILAVPGGNFDPNCQDKGCLELDRNFVPTWQFLWAILPDVAQLVGVNLTGRWKPDGSGLTRKYNELIAIHGIYKHPRIEEIDTDQALKLCPGIKNIRIMV